MTTAGAALALACAAAPAAYAAHTAPAAPQRICDEVLVPMSDGVRLHAWVSRLAPDRPRPVLFMMDSYSRGGVPGRGPRPDNACPRSLPDDYVPAFLSQDVTDRYTLVQVAYRGTGSSEGAFDMSGARTQRDLHEAIAWAAALPQSTGAVTLVGESGTGFIAHFGLTDPHVRAAAIFTSCADMYRCMHRGGLYNTLADVYLSSTVEGYAGGLAARLRMGATRGPSAFAQLAALTGALARTKADGVDDAWWRQRSALDALAATRIPVLYTTDLYDIVQPFDAFQRTPGARLSLGMGHLAQDTAAAGGERYRAAVRAQADRFVAHYGLGDDNGAQRDPKVTVVTNTGSDDAYHAGRVLVRRERAWPLPGTRWTALSLGPAGTLAEQPGAPGADTALLASLPRPDTRATALLAGTAVPSDLRADEALGLTYTTPVLQRDLEVTGPITLRLYASTTAPDLDWSVRVADVAPDGASEWITDGYLRASLRRTDPARALRAHGRVVRPWLTYDTPQAVPAGVPVRYDVPVIETSNVFRAGHRLRLDVLPVTGGEPDTPRTLGLGSVTVLRDAAHPSSLLLPVIPARCGRGAPLTAATPHVDCARSYHQAVRG